MPIYDAKAARRSFEFALEYVATYISKRSDDLSDTAEDLDELETVFMIQKQLNAIKIAFLETQCELLYLQQCKGGCNGSERSLD